MSTTESRHLDSSESVRVQGPADVKIKRGADRTLGEMDKEGLNANDIQDKLNSTWETVQTKSSELLGQVKGQAASLQSKANDLAQKAKTAISNDSTNTAEDEGFEEVHYNKGRKRTNLSTNKVKQQLNSGLETAKGKLDSSLNQLPSADEVKSRFARLLDTQTFNWQDLLAYLIPLVVLSLALTAGIAAYRSYMVPPPLPPINSMEGIKARANLWGSEAYDYVHDKGEDLLDYTTEKTSLLAEQLKSGVGIYSDKAAEAMWKAKDQAAEQANLAYKESLKKANEAKRLADKRSREALKELRSYAKDKTAPEGFLDKLSNKFDDLKDSLGRKTGMLGEDAVHKANLAKENARHAKEEAKLKAADTGLGGKIKHAAHDLKESVKAKIHPHL